ncbi:MAG: sulfatase-like hydrolase/transferase [Candidatus Aminicenantes bacterium]|nr:sulfatase-like hydrolase/transferase [Candidatus Aminicenantes bacterium]
MNKIKILALLAVVLLVAAAVFFLTRPAAHTATAPLNVLVITIDTMRADRLGCYGDHHAKTPALDDLAAKGVLFENCYSPVPLTLPAHCSIFSGRWPLAHGVRNNGSYKLDAEEVTLAEKLKQAGYDTTALVAAYVLKSKFGLDQGFDRYNDQLGYEAQAGNIDAEITADRVYAKFKDWLEHKDDKPFFLWVHFYDPHKPYAPPADYLQASAGDAYRGEVAYVDFHVGCMIADLKERRLIEHTLVVITGDHGEAFGEHREYGHGIFCYEESVKVPLIFISPVLPKKSTRIHARVSLVDIMPTVLKMLGKDSDKNCQGLSLLASMTGSKEAVARSIYLESMYGRELNNWAPLTGWLKNHFKYISLPQAELYDLQADPAEKTNLFYKNNRLARQMDDELAQWVGSQQARNVKVSRTALQADDKKKLAALGYISSFASAGRAGTDPKTGIGYQIRFSELIAALDRGETARVEAEALRLCDETAALKLPLPYILLNYVYEKKQQWDKLEANLRLASEKFSDNPAQTLNFQGNLLEFYFSNGKVGAVEQLAAVMLRLDPERTRVLEILGEINEKRRDWPAALNWYSQAQKSESGNARLSKKVIKMLTKTGAHQAALAESEALLRTEGAATDTDLLFTAAMLAIEAGEGTRSESYMLRLIEVEPTAQHWFDYALVTGRNGKYSEAIERMEKALTLSPNNLDAERRRAAAKALQVWKARRR